MTLFLILFGVAAVSGACVLVVAIIMWSGARRERSRLGDRIESFRAADKSGMAASRVREMALAAVGPVTIPSLTADPDLVRQVMEVLKDSAVGLEPPPQPAELGGVVKVKDGGGGANAPEGAPGSAQGVVLLPRIVIAAPAVNAQEPEPAGAGASNAPEPASESGFASYEFVDDAAAAAEAGDAATAASEAGVAATAASGADDEGAVAG
jgi:hypothetical protein